MKVAIITVLFPCPSETFVLSQITGLLDKGANVQIFARDKVIDSELPESTEKYNLIQRTTYYGMEPDEMPRFKVYRIIKALKLFLKSSNATRRVLLKSLSHKKFGKKIFSLQYFYYVHAFANKGLEKFDVVHCQFGTLGQIATVLKKVGIIKGRLITSFHGYDLSVHLKKSGQDSYTELFQYGDLFLPISNFWKEKLINLGCPDDKVVRHKMGVDLNKYLFQPRSQKEGCGRVKLLSVGRMVEKKGMEYGIRALAKIYPSNQTLLYRIVGDGELFNHLKSLVKHLGLDDAVEFMGWKEPNEIIELMTDSDIFLAPCVTAKNGDQEGIPMVIMEAMALGLPVISTYHTGIPELIENEKTGYLVEERDVDGLADSIELLISNIRKQRDFSSAGRKKVEEDFNSNTLNDQLLSLYHSISAD